MPSHAISTATPTTEPNARISHAVRVLEKLLGVIRTKHPDVPDVVVVIATGREQGTRKLGHFAYDTWAVREKRGRSVRDEILLAAEGLSEKPEMILMIIIHEAAHGVAKARHVKDTSRGYRYHNERYKAIAEEMGLRVERVEEYGWAMTEMTAKTFKEYKQLTAAVFPQGLRKALTFDQFRREPKPDLDEPDKPENDRSGGKRVSLACKCQNPRRILLSRSVAERGPIICGVCDNHFT